MVRLPLQELYSGSPTKDGQWKIQIPAAKSNVRFSFLTNLQAGAEFLMLSKKNNPRKQSKTIQKTS